MRIYKTSNKNRTTYRYTFQAPVNIDGKMQTCFTIKPCENGVTEADIKMLHAEDNREVYYNTKNLRPGRTAEEKVKNTILEWKLKLKAEGIVGENMTFSKEEKVCATNIPQTVNNYYGNTNVINSPSSNVQIVFGSENTVSFSYGKVKDMITEVEISISESDLSKDGIETAVELLDDIQSKTEEEKKPHILKSALVGLQDFLINIGANVAAELIQAKIQGLL